MADEDDTMFNFTSLLFGNIDDTGQLDDDILDEDCKKHLNSLGKLGLKPLLNEVFDANDIANNDTTADENYEEETKDPLFLPKSPSAVDYSEISELADEVAESDSKAGLKIIIDSENMPPPLVPVSKPSAHGSEDSRKRKLETPLAAMLPEKYANVDVREFFPDFRVSKVLRFSRLFGPGKSSVLPKIWRSVKKRRKRNKFDDPTSMEESSKKIGWSLNYATPPTSPSRILSDDEAKFLKPMEDREQQKEKENNDSMDSGPKVADWRFGPAQLWYDMLDVPETGDGFDYGFKTKENNNNTLKEINGVSNQSNDIPDESFLMVAQTAWEEDIIWDDSEETKQKVMQNLNCKTNAAGWLPSSSNRTAQTFSQPGKGILPTLGGSVRLGSGQMNPPNKSNNKMSGKQGMDDNSDDTWYSIFPVENEELVYGTWEDEVIWDPECVSQVPKPKILTLDPNDENIILGIPDDVDPQKQRADNVTPVKVKIPHPHVKKSKLLLGKAGVINVLEEDTPPPPSKSPDHDPFNVSNDSYYLPRSSETSLKLKVGGGNLIQHSTPVVELRAPFVQTQMGPMRLRNFHRPQIKRFSNGALAHPGPHGITPLMKYIKKKAKQREQERIASGGGDMFFMRTPEDLTGRDGELILVEFCEEHPPLINQVGMCSKIKNYYKRKASKDEGPTHFRYGEVAYAHTSPFLGVLPPGKSMQVVENNMYRAPIYEHKLQETDFLVIRTRHQYFIREFDALFTVGQLCPLYEVPGPNSKRANNFVRDFLQVFIYRLFWRSKDTPKRIRMDDIKKAFPSHSESSIRKRLKLCADFKRTGKKNSQKRNYYWSFLVYDPLFFMFSGSDSNWWVIKPDFRLPPEEEIRAMVSPEQCCAYFSMIAAEQRLKDAGYGEKFFFAPDDDDEDLQLKMDDEIKVAPWNTTRAYIQAMKGKCLLQLTGPADPTGCGEGFSYVRMPNKPMTRQSKEEQETQPKRMVTGTDADLRRLSLNNAKALLRKFGVPEEEIKKLSRWEVIDVVRTLSTEKAKAGEEGMTKFSRGNRFSIAEHQERYKEECQRIFDLQNRVLSSCEVLSTDEGESSDEEDGSDIEEMGKNIENMLANKKTSMQLTLEREEQERQELRKMLYGSDDKKSSKDKKKEEEDFVNNYSNNQTGRVLKIYRTFRDAEGKEYTRMEVVRKQAVIDAYVKIRTTKDEGFIKQFAVLDDAQKEEMKREKRRIQEQLRRIKRNQEKEKSGLGGMHNTSPLRKIPTGLQTVKRLHDSSKHSHQMHDEVAASAVPIQRRRPTKIKPDLKVKCGACGATGHMRTNRACPQYQLNAPPPPVNVALTQEQENEIQKQMNNEVEDLVNVDGTKLTISGKLIKHHEDIKRRSLLLKVPKDALTRKRRKNTNELHCDYLKKHQKPANRRRTDPLVVLSTYFEAILNEIRNLPDVQPFLFPVNVKNVPDYHNIVDRPMDLQTMRENIRQKRYATREDFISDLNQIVQNSTLYNGAMSSLTLAAKRMLDVCVERLKEKEDKMMKLEKEINPLLNDDHQVRLSFILETILNKLKKMSESWPFIKPVDKKQVVDYYDIVKRPMDLETISKKVKAHKYHSRYEFLADIELIFNNCFVYNGRDSSFTERAEVVWKAAQTSLEEYDAQAHLTTLEQQIKKVQEKAEIDSLSSSWYAGDEDQTQESLSSSPTYVGMKTELMDSSEMEIDSKEFVKAETKQILAEDLHCSSEDDEADDDMMEEVKGEYDDLTAIDYNQTQVAAAEAMMQLDSLTATETYSGDVVDTRITENKTFDDDFLMCKEEMQDKRQYQELMSGVPEESGGVHDDLEISDSDDEMKEKNIDIPDKIVQSNVDNEDDDPDGLWF
ncbi:transcription initiation factor TFIID subunit 1 isoform X2 [Planococcus citri]|uniref:transcription initiation factor TFIID subunit 1 isoform X2 n=1 Tax=Planococcus citri TaxID=170843 RepID=UPI0031F87F67